MSLSLVLSSFLYNIIYVYAPIYILYLNHYVHFTKCITRGPIKSNYVNIYSTEAVLYSYVYIYMGIACLFTTIELLCHKIQFSLR